MKALVVMPFFMHGTNLVIGSIMSVDNYSIRKNICKNTTDCHRRPYPTYRFCLSIDHSRFSFVIFQIIGPTIVILLTQGV